MHLNPISLLAALFLPCLALAEAPLALLATPGHFAILRHALAPGGGDPPGFRIGDRATQRNLSEAGREQARRLGDKLREHGIAQAAVFTSEWYRCRDTAALLGVGEAVGLPVLNSFFATPEVGPEQMRALRAWIDEQALDRPLVLVTHQVVITSLTDVFPSSGELIVLRREENGSLRVAARVPPE